jgi:hypothetical protein
MLRVQTWIGRAEELEALSRALDGNRTVIVCGLPGAGKTALVREFLERENLSATWLSAPYTDPVPEECELLVVEERLDGTASAFVDAFLSRARSRKAIVIASEPSRFPGAPKVSVGGLSLKANLEQLSDAMQFFVDIAPTPILPKDHVLVQAIVDSVDGHPASLQALAARLRVHTLEELAAQLGRLRELLGPSVTSRLLAAYTTLGPDETRIVQVATLFGGTVTLEDLRRTVELEDRDLLTATQSLADLGLFGATNARLVCHDLSCKHFRYRPSILRCNIGSPRASSRLRARTGFVAFILSDLVRSRALVGTWRP